MKKIILFALTIMLSPFGIRAQTSTGTTPSMISPVAIGNGLQAPLRFAGEEVPANQLSLGFGATTFYNDNVFMTNATRDRDEGLSFTSIFAFTRQTENSSFNFNYVPSFYIYDHTDEYDRLNHTGSLDLKYRFSPRWVLMMSDSTSYQNGLLQAVAGQPISSGISSPSSPNQSIFPTTSRTFSNAGAMDITFVKSNRSSISFTGNYNSQEFSNQETAGESLFNGRQATGGFQYQHLVTEHTSVGFELLHEDSTYRGGSVVGGLQRYQTESALLAFQSHFKPSLTVSLFGGGQYVTTFGESAGVSATRSTQWAGGGSVTKAVRRTAVDLSVQRRVSDSGGVYGQVEYNTAMVGLRRRLVGLWEADLRASGSRITTEEPQIGSGRAEAIQGEFDVARSFGKNSSVRISYINSHQLTSGTLPFGQNFDLNLVTLAIDFRLKPIPITH